MKRYYEDIFKLNIAIDNLPKDVTYHVTSETLSDKKLFCLIINHSAGYSNSKREPREETEESSDINMINVIGKVVAVLTTMIAVLTIASFLTNGGL